VGKQLQRYREQAGLSRSGLAKAAKVHRNTVYLVESGRSKPGLGILTKLARALHLNGPEKLLDEAEVVRSEAPNCWNVSWVRPSLDGPFLLKTLLGICPSQRKADVLARAFVKEHGGSYELEPCFTVLPSGLYPS
jgi:transcriptional regulator with XRE-family HTH domain